MIFKLNNKRMGVGRGERDKEICEDLNGLEPLLELNS